jgi:4-diphosphocytidyl-2-C-methyl-D-erythritol kinase
MIIKSFSKLNLSLRIRGKLKNGLHDIQSNIFLTSLYDKISINKIKNKKDIIIFTGKFGKNIQKYKNSVAETLALLRKLKIIKSNSYKIIVDKKIPVFAGLGGGTSNSAFLMKYFLKKNASSKIVNIFEKKIGTDFRLFFKKQSYQKNLRKILSYKNIFFFHILLVYPNVKCITKIIYSLYRKNKKEQFFQYQNITSKEKFLNLLKKDKNDLQKIVEKKYQKIKNILNFINMQHGCEISRITGSGSVCFGLFKSKKTAFDALCRIKRKFPKYWSIYTKTI